MIGAMGEKNSSLTRVQPVFNELLNRWPSGQDWVQRLCEMATATRASARPQGNMGPLMPQETPQVAKRVGKVFERAISAPTAFLRWLIRHPERMHCSDEVNFGSRDPGVSEWRRKLLRGNAEERKDAIDEGLKALENTPAVQWRGKWWVFEGRSHIDCCLMTEQCVLFVEGKRTESVSPATQWFTQRSQLWRNVETAQEFAAGKQFGVILAVETDVDGRVALEQAATTLVASYPHLDDSSCEELSRHLLGYVTWPAIVREFGLPETCLIDRVAPSGEIGEVY
jgi:hypothetical protein